MESVDARVGFRVRELRLARGWSGVKTAKKLGVSKQVLCKWEKCGYVREKYYNAIMSVFGISFEDLFSRVKPEDVEWKAAGKQLKDDSRQKLIEFIDTL